MHFGEAKYETFLIADTLKLEILSHGKTVAFSADEQNNQLQQWVFIHGFKSKRPLTEG